MICFLYRTGYPAFCTVTTVRFLRNKNISGNPNNTIMEPTTKTSFTPIVNDSKRIESVLLAPELINSLEWSKDLLDSSEVNTAIPSELNTLRTQLLIDVACPDHSTGISSIEAVLLGTLASPMPRLRTTIAHIIKL